MGLLYTRALNESFMPWLAGALSDASSSKYRRRFWILLSTVALVVSTITLAYCIELASFFVDIFGVGNGDWTERRDQLVGDLFVHARVLITQECPN